jgi:hypothetical protein
MLVCARLVECGYSSSHDEIAFHPINDNIVMRTRHTQFLMIYASVQVLNCLGAEQWGVTKFGHMSDHDGVLPGKIREPCLSIMALRHSSMHIQGKMVN